MNAGMNTAMEPENLAELIADCAAVPRTEVPEARQAASPRPWRVDDACHAQVADLDEYI